MKLKYLFWAALAGSLLFSAKQLKDLNRLQGAMKADPGVVPQQLERMAAENPAMAKVVSDQIQALDAALSADGGSPSAAAAGGAARAPQPAADAPRGPVDARAWDTNSMRRGRGQGAVPGGGVIIDSSGRRHVFTPRPASLGDRAAKTVSRVALPELPWPDLGGAAASPGARRLRAVGLLVFSMLVTFALLRWARRFRP